MSYHTLVIEGNINEHPRTVQINGIIYYVSSSAQGHSIAEKEPYAELIQAVSEFQYEHFVNEDFIPIVDEVIKKANTQRESGYVDE